MLLASALLFSATGLSTNQSVVVFHLDRDYRPVANLERLGQMPEGMKAILAMYALQVGGGCEGDDEQGLKCELTRALRLGAQCSERHVDLVRAWFGASLPAMSGHYSQDGVLQAKDLMSICYAAPHYATHQNIWESIQVGIEDDVVYIDAVSSWMQSADGPFGTEKFSSTYRIEQGRVTVLSHSRSK